MKQTSLFSADSINPVEVESADKHIARIQAALAYNDAHLKRFYAVRLPDILRSLDTHRIRSLLDYLRGHMKDNIYIQFNYPDFALDMVSDHWEQIEKWHERFGITPEYQELIAAQRRLVQEAKQRLIDNGRYHDYAHH